MRNSRRRGRFSRQSTTTKYDIVSDAQRKRWEASVVLSQHKNSTTAREDYKTDSGVLLDLADDMSKLMCNKYLLLMTFINYRHSLRHWSTFVSCNKSTAKTCKSK